MRSILDLAYGTVGRAAACQVSKGSTSSADTRLKATLRLKLVKSGRKTPWRLNWVSCINPVVCAVKAEKRQTVCRVFPRAPVDVCKVPVGADGGGDAS